MNPQRMKLDGGGKISLRPSIAAYGFDALEFKTPGDSQPLPAGGLLHFIGLKEVYINLEDFDGIIVPQGIFESYRRLSSAL